MDFLSIDGLEFEGVEVPKEKVKDNASQEEAIDLSCRIIEVLDGKVLEHNENYPQNKTGLNQLKEVFRKSSEDCSNEENCMEVGMARVNMFLRLVKGDKMEISNVSSANKIIDISNSLILNEEDVEQAKADIEKYNLNFNFETSNDLFLERDPNFEWKL